MHDAGRKMSRSLTATVTLQPGVVFTAQVTNLTPMTLFLRTNEELHFRDLVHVNFNGVQLHAQIALVTRDPCGALIVFQAPPSARAIIDELITQVDVLEADTLERQDSWAAKTAVREHSESRLPTTEPMGVAPFVMDPEPEKTEESLLEPTIPPMAPGPPMAAQPAPRTATSRTVNNARQAQMTRHDPSFVPTPGEAALALEKRKKPVEATDVVRRVKRDDDITELDPATLMEDKD